MRVVLLGLVTAIDQYKNIQQVCPFAQVVFDHFPRPSLLLRNLCVAVPWQVYQEPTAVHQEMIDEFCLARGGRCFGKGFPAGKSC